MTLTLSRSAQIRDLGATQSHKEVGLGHFEGLSLGTILLTSAETFTVPFSARDSEVVRVSDPETVVEGMLK